MRVNRIAGGSLVDYTGTGKGELERGNCSVLGHDVGVRGVLFGGVTIRISGGGVPPLTELGRVRIVFFAEVDRHHRHRVLVTLMLLLRSFRARDVLPNGSRVIVTAGTICVIALFLATGDSRR